MTLLTVAQRVADAVGLPRPASVAGSTDQLARQMFSLANDTLEELGKMDWPQLDTAYSFNTVVDQTAYALPAGYARFATDTAFITSEYYSLRGSLTPKEWAIRRNGMSQMVGRLRYRVFGYPQMLQFVPAPQTVQNITIEYLSNLLVIGSDDVRRTLYSEDSDMSVVPEELVRKGLKWRIKHAKGLDYSQDFNDYETSCAELYAQTINLPSTPVAYRYPWGNEDELGFPVVPETGYGQ